MRTSDSDIIIVPGLDTPDEEHWQTRWASRLSTARLVERDGTLDPDGWAARITAAVDASRRPAVILAHGLGVLAAVRAAPAFREEVVRGAFLVAPVDAESAGAPDPASAFAPVPRDPLPFPSLLVASRNDPACDYGAADDLSHAWGSALVDAGEAGGLDGASGHGPWPEGLMRLAGFLKRL